MLKVGGKIRHKLISEKRDRRLCWKFLWIAFSLGAGHKVLLLIEGKAHSYVFCSPGCKKWDTCAPEAILHSVGGKLTDIKGNDYEYHKEVGFVNDWGTLATGKAEDHKDYLDRIPQECKDQVKDYFKNRPKK